MAATYYFDTSALVKRYHVEKGTSHLDAVFGEFDSAHGFAHRDLYRRSGGAIKTPLRMDFRTARTFAQEDILANWRRYRDLFLEE